MRRTSEALRKGEITLLSARSGVTPFLAFLRASAGETVLVVHNLSDSFQSAGPFAAPGSTFERVFADSGAADPSGAPESIRVYLPGRGTGIWRVR